MRRSILLSGMVDGGGNNDDNDNDNNVYDCRGIEFTLVVQITMKIKNNNKKQCL